VRCWLEEAEAAEEEEEEQAEAEEEEEAKPVNMIARVGWEVSGL
jgi:hypothetical protein